MLLIIKSDFVVGVLVGDTRTKTSLLYLYSNSFIAAITTIKGYFYGKQEVVPNAISQVAEQVVKLLAVYLLATFYSWRYDKKMLFATIGLIVGEMRCSQY